MLRAPKGNNVDLSADVFACFVDLARFTTISEALGATGSAGTEVLVNLINQFFTPAIEAASDLGGDVVGFGGDALTVIFPQDGLDHACQWAWSVMQTITKIEPVLVGDEQFVVEAKVGIGSGSVDTVLVGTGTTRRAVTGGVAIDAAVEAEGLLQPGQIGLMIGRNSLIGPDSLPKTATLTQQAGLVLLNDWTNLTLNRLFTADTPKPTEDELAPFVPSRVIERLEGHVDSLLDEHRPATVVFAGFGARTALVDQVAVDELNRAIEIVEQHGGTIINVGTGDKGTTLLAAFGAPVAFAEQRSAAVFASAQLAESLNCKVGVATGLCFAGRVGASSRWSYNLIGDVPNIAARLMSLAPSGGVLADHATYHAADHRLVWEPAKSFQLKGKEGETLAARFQSLSDQVDASTDLPLTGRADELQTLLDLIDSAAKTRQGQSVLVKGESGIGKTRFTRAAIDMARSRGYRVATTSSASQASARSYGTWFAMIYQIFDLADDAGPAEFETKARAQLQDADGDRSALLRQVVFGQATTSELLIGLEAKSVAEIIDSLLAEVILSVDEPSLLIIDDAQDLDEASLRLLGLVLARLPATKATVVVAAHPGSVIDSWVWPHQIHLNELGETESCELLADHQRKTEGAVDEALQHNIFHHVGGNPQLLRLLADHARSAGKIDLPNDARSIVLGRFDRLEASTQQVLTKAATLGRNLTWADFLGAFGDDAGQRAALEDLIQQRLIERAAGDELSFASPILQQVAYEAAAHASRAGFHNDVGLYFEQALRGGIEAKAQELAHHFSFVDDLGRHRRYFPAAARQAQRAFANSRAISWFERAIGVASLEEAPSLHYELGTATEHVGRWEAAAISYRAATADASVGPKALASLARLELETAGYDVARQTLVAAVAAAENSGDDATLEWVLEKAGLVHLNAGQYETARDTAARQLTVAVELGVDTRIAAALSNSGAAKSWLGDLEAARSELTKSLELALSVGALAMAADIEMDLAMVALDEGQLDESLVLLASVRTRADAIGYRRGQAVAAANTALALMTADRHDEVWEPATTAWRLHLETGEVIAAAAPLGMAGMLLLAEGRPHDSIAFLARILRIGRKTGSEMYRERAYAVLIDAYEMLGDDDRAQQCRSQQDRDEADVADNELDYVAPLSALSQGGQQPNLEEWLNEADELIARLGQDDAAT